MTQSKLLVRPKPNSLQGNAQNHISPSPISSRSPPPQSPGTGASMSPDDSTSGPGQPIMKIVTSKAWVLPPRPKPGRKPSADAPGTKRKAQNRAAQRAFRERRATKVAELEEKIKGIVREKENAEQKFNNVLSKLTTENTQLRQSLDSMRKEMDILMSFHNNGYTGNEHHNHHTKSDINSSSNGSSLISNNPSGNINRNSSPPRNSSANDLAYNFQQQIVSPAPSNVASPNDILDRVLEQRLPENNIHGNINNNNNDDDCGVCLKDDCLCESLGIRNRIPSISVGSNVSHERGSIDTKASSNLNIVDSNDNTDSFAPMPAVPLKRKRDSNDDREIDFTVKFTKQQKLKALLKPPKNDRTFLPQPKNLEITEDFQRRQQIELLARKEEERLKKKKALQDSGGGRAFERCGFCSDDTPCLCEEAENNNDDINAEVDLDVGFSTLPPLIGDFTDSLNSNGTSKLPVLHPGPTQRQISVNSLAKASTNTLLSAASFNPDPIIKKKEKPEGCTGNPGTCEQCQHDPMSTLFCTTIASMDVEKHSSKSTSKSTSISSASTPKKDDNLSTNGLYIPCADAYKTLSRHKDFNSLDISKLVGKLHTRGMQVEVQSVANVLRELDRRLYN